MHAFDLVFAFYSFLRKDDHRSRIDTVGHLGLILESKDSLVFVLKDRLPF